MQLARCYIKNVKKKDSNKSGEKTMAAIALILSCLTLGFVLGALLVMKISNDVIGKK